VELKLYNTLTRQKETFTPLDPKRVRLFVCGPTVYDLSHIGHARTYIAFDVVARTLRKFGHPLEYLVNITDIDDKIINRANEAKREFSDVAKEFENEFYTDMERLGIDSVSQYARASDFIPQILKQIRELEQHGFAYKTGSGVYFRVKNFKDYGKLSRQNLDEIKSGARVEADEEKEDPADFVLWKAAKPGEPTWDSPWGPGRPGWHIEDTAITYSLFGPQYDIHGGGIDLIFPHHESEIAQNEAAYDVKPLATYWMHSGHLNIKGVKMSKSLGNFITIRDILEKTSPEALRLLVLQSHYRSPFDYDESLLGQAEASLERLTGFRNRLEHARTGKGGKLQRRIAEAQEAFDTALANDVDTPAAIAVLFDVVRDVNPMIEDGSLSPQDRDRVLGFLRETDGVLGIIPGKQVSAPDDVIALAEKREEARKSRDFDASDTLREQIRMMGWEVEDTDQGPRLVKRQ
jgi:cysteinyl-tRNA synthetase